jgi:uncharacterized membrane protein YkoI
MTSRRSWAALFLTTAAVCALLAPSAPQSAASDIDHVAARKLQESGEILPLEKITERARAEKPGRVLEAELEYKKGRYVYEVEILDERGQVWELKLDARTGNLIKVEIDD